MNGLGSILPLKIDVDVKFLTSVGKVLLLLVLWTLRLFQLQGFFWGEGFNSEH